MVPVTPPPIGKADLAVIGLPEALPCGIEGALLPRSGDAAAALAERAPDLDVRAVALAADGHAKLGAAAGVIGVAFETLSAPLVELDLAASSPGAEQGIEGGAGGFAGEERGAQSAPLRQALPGGERAVLGEDFESHRASCFPKFALREQAEIAITP